MGVYGDEETYLRVVANGRKKEFVVEHQCQPMMAEMVSQRLYSRFLAMDLHEIKCFELFFVVGSPVSLAVLTLIAKCLTNAFHIWDWHKFFPESTYSRKYST